MGASGIAMRQLLFAITLSLAQVTSAQWIPNSANGKEYALTSPLGWDQAQATATSNGAHLAVIRSPAEEAWIAQTFGAGLWIGYTDAAVEGQWVWVTGEPTTHTNWCPGEPNNASNEDHGQITNCGWNDADGLAQLPGLMERPLSTPSPLQWIQSPINGHYYALSPQASWTGAEQLAQQYGGHLATVRNQAENNWLASVFFSGTECHWIGLNDAQTEGLFVWSSGEPITFTNWHPGEPTNGNGVEDWCHLGLPWVGPSVYASWNDSPNGVTSYGWVCRGILETSSLTLASYATFGSGCSGPSGTIPALDGVTGQLPRLGTTTRIRVTNLPLALTIPVFFFGRSNTVQSGSPSYPLPLDLGVLGWPGCGQLVSADVQYFEITATGQAEVSIDVPYDPQLVGQEFFGQVLALHFPTGASVSNGLQGTMGF